MNWLIETLRAHPEIALFLTLALGYALTRVRLGPIQLECRRRRADRRRRRRAAADPGARLAAVGVLRPLPLLDRVPDRPAVLPWTGTERPAPGGPRPPALRDGARQRARAVQGLRVRRRCRRRPARRRVERLGGHRHRGRRHRPARRSSPPRPRRSPPASTVAFAVTYLVGLLTEIFTLTTVGPWLMRADLAAECRKLESELGRRGRRRRRRLRRTRASSLRAYAVPARLDGRTVAEVERSFAPARVFVERLRTPDGVVDPDARTRSFARATSSRSRVASRRTSTPRIR